MSKLLNPEELQLFKQALDHAWDIVIFLNIGRYGYPDNAGLKESVKLLDQARSKIHGFDLSDIELPPTEIK